LHYEVLQQNVFAPKISVYTIRSLEPKDWRTDETAASNDRHIFRHERNAGRYIVENSTRRRVPFEKSISTSRPFEETTRTTAIELAAYGLVHYCAGSVGGDRRPKKLQ
jgi:hypothetical protein